MTTLPLLGFGSGKPTQTLYCHPSAATSKQRTLASTSHKYGDTISQRNVSVNVAINNTMATDEKHVDRYGTSPSKSLDNLLLFLLSHVLKSGGEKVLRQLREVAFGLCDTRELVSQTDQSNSGNIAAWKYANQLKEACNNSSQGRCQLPICLADADPMLKAWRIFEAGLNGLQLLMGSTCHKNLEDEWIKDGCEFVSPIPDHALKPPSRGSGSVSPFGDISSTHNGAELSVKVYRLEQVLSAEDKLLDFAWTALKFLHHNWRAVSEYYVRDQLPTLFVPDYYRKNYNIMMKRRKLVDINHENVRQSIEQRLAFHRPQPIHELAGNSFFTAWVGCFQAHWKLWQNGSRHCIIIPDNLMYYKDAQGRIVSVLNDFDIPISSSSNIKPVHGIRRTGTRAFLATDLVIHSEEEELPPHLYGLSTSQIYKSISVINVFVEYDVESLIYVLIWITSRYGIVDGKVRLVEPDAFRKWVKGSRFASIRSHVHALQDAWRRKEEFDKQPDHPCMVAHANHQDVISKLCRYLFIHKQTKRAEKNLIKRILRLSDPDEIRRRHIDRLDPKHEMKVNQRIMDIVEGKLDPEIFALEDDVELASAFDIAGLGDLGGQLRTMPPDTRE
ncbi:hypothetical protein BDY19DRAFT_647893 [Irpex rosettiformis]|uniref:Uncharacterized protein n=1 Tax=Irpex rosettiformis TaxID=378272 RepID=A0ACB8TNH1_9APHY|nr:hypothetical protein BDY19DRAFT_647893 [Irpex rosettiformis]